MLSPFDKIDKGIIFTVMENVYIDFPGGAWSDHFTEKETFWISLEFPTNNGNFKARNSKGIMKWFSTMNVKRVIG